MFLITKLQDDLCEFLLILKAPQEDMCDSDTACLRIWLLTHIIVVIPNNIYSDNHLMGWIKISWVLSSEQTRGLIITFERVALGCGHLIIIDGRGVRRLPTKQTLFFQLSGEVSSFLKNDHIMHNFYKLLAKHKLFVDKISEANFFANSSAPPIPNGKSLIKQTRKRKALCLHLVSRNGKSV